MFLKLPKDASDELPSRSMVSVEGAFNDVPFVATLEPDGNGGHWLRIDAELGSAVGAVVGETAVLEIAPVAKEPEPKVPQDLQNALAANPKALAVWIATTPLARRDWIQWINTGKKAETRLIRIEKTIDKLASGKKRPCCFDRSGMYDGSMSCPLAESED